MKTKNWILIENDIIDLNSVSRITFYEDSLQIRFKGMEGIIYWTSTLDLETYKEYSKQIIAKTLEGGKSENI